MIMTYDQMIEVLQAAKAGNKIQLRPIHEREPWTDENRPCWDFYRYEYRVKSEPRVGWVHVTDIWDNIAGSSLSGKKGAYIKVKEVID